jgi:hypothetical protein
VNKRSRSKPIFEEYDPSKVTEGAVEYVKENYRKYTELLNDLQELGCEPVIIGRRKPQKWRKDLL